ncbi:MAG: hypothetical protein LBG52_08305 [Candidatus Peribacteria bacterium]|jgi:hypothetical protein|nr:hypothetical protein [Candidatus Peribacteria bacterium]
MTLHQKVRFTLTGLITLITYGICMFTLFETNALLISLASFIILFISLYFLAIDLQTFHHRKIGILLLLFTIGELIFFGGTTWHSYAEIVLFNLAIGLLLFFLFFQLKHRIHFSAFTYFTEGGYTIAATLTLFFSVLMLGKYSAIPFTCEDLIQFSDKLVGSEVFKKFVPSKTASHPQPLPSFEKSEVEQFFENTTTFFKSQIGELSDSVSKNSCEFLMGKLRTTQVHEGFQLAVLALMYFILIGIFKILLWMISVIGFLIFLLLKPLHIFTYEKVMIEKEMIK